MIEENEQNKKNDKKNHSSAETIDTFFGSHDFDKRDSNQDNIPNYKETEKLIDKILDGTPQEEHKQNDLKPSVTITETENDSRDPHAGIFTPPEQINEEKKEEHFFPATDKEEIFKIDKPEKSTAPNTKKTDANQKNSFHNPTKNEHKNEKIKFSLKLPKINIKLKKKKTKQDKITNPQPLNQQKEKKSLFKQKKSLEEELDKKTGRIHGLSQLNEEETQKQKKVTTNTTDENQSKEKKSVLKSKNKSLNPFKKKSDLKNKEPTTPVASVKATEKEPAQKTKTSDLNDTAVDEDLIKLLKITDDLLGKLPENVIEEFSQSEDFSLYEKIMKKYEIVK